MIHIVFVFFSFKKLEQTYFSSLNQSLSDLKLSVSTAVWCDSCLEHSWELPREQMDAPPPSPGWLGFLLYYSPAVLSVVTVCGVSVLTSLC